MQVKEFFRKVLVTGCVSVLVALASAAPADAAVQEHGRNCRPGPSGNVCAVVRENGSEVRARIGLDGNGRAYICLQQLVLWKIDREGSMTLVARRSGGSADCVLNEHKSFYTTPVLIDRTRSYFAQADYRTRTAAVPGDPGTFYSFYSGDWKP